MTAAEVISKKVEARGITLSELSRRTNVKPHALRRVVAGERLLKADEFVALCKELDLDIEDFDTEPD